MCLCCFLTVSCLINAILASFNVLVFQLLRRRKGKTRLYYNARKKSYKNYLQSTPIVPKLRLSTERRFFFLKNVNLVPTSSHGLKRTRNVAKKFELTASVQPFFCKVTYRWRCSDVVCGLVATSHVQNPPQQGWTREKSTHTKPDSQGYPGNAFACALTISGGINAGFRPIAKFKSLLSYELFVAWWLDFRKNYVLSQIFSSRLVVFVKVLSYEVLSLV